MTNTELKKTAFEILYQKLGKENTERFMTLFLKNPEDYTLWQSNFFQTTETVKSFSQKAMEYRKSRES